MAYDAQTYPDVIKAFTDDDSHYAVDSVACFFGAHPRLHWKLRLNSCQHAD